MIVGGWLVKLKDKELITYRGNEYSIVTGNDWLQVIYSQPEKSRLEKQRFLFFNCDYKVIETEEVQQVCLLAPKEQVEYVKVFCEENKDEGSGNTQKSE